MHVSMPLLLVGLFNFCSQMEWTLGTNFKSLNFSQNRMDNIKITRIRIGHCNLTNNYLIIRKYPYVRLWWYINNKSYSYFLFRFLGTPALLDYMSPYKLELRLVYNNNYFIIWIQGHRLFLYVLYIADLEYFVFRFYL